MLVESALLETLVADQANARKHDQKNLRAIESSLKKFGQVEPLVVQKSTGVVIGGNGRLEVMRKLGMKTAEVVRLDVDNTTAAALAIALNRTSELAEWDEEVLGKILHGLREDGMDLGDLGFELDDLPGLGIEAPGWDEEREDDVPEVPAETWVRPGNIFQLGDHRLLCGDSTKREDVERLMAGEKADMVFTDPPYGVDYDGGTTKREKLAGDDSTDLYGPACKMAYDFSVPESPLYLWHAAVKGTAAAAAAAAAGYEIRCELIWNKNLAQFGAPSAQYKQKHEPAFYCFKRGKTVNWNGPTNEVTVWDCNRSSKNEFHPTQKPVELAERAIGNHSATRILDLFGGSGSTLVAAEKKGKRAFLIELSPYYCQVIIDRYKQVTGKEAVLLG